MAETEPAHKNRYRQSNTLMLTPARGVSVNGKGWRFRTPCGHHAPRWQSAETVRCATCKETYHVEAVTDAKTDASLADAMRPEIGNGD